MAETIMETFSPAVEDLHQLFMAFVDEGFTREEAMRLIRTILAEGIRGGALPTTEANS